MGQSRQAAVGWNLWGARCLAVHTYEPVSVHSALSCTSVRRALNSIHLHWAPELLLGSIFNANRIGICFKGETSANILDRNNEMVTTPHTLYIAGGFKNHCDSANFHAVTPWCSNLFVHQMAGAPYGYTNGSGPTASALPLLTANQPLPQFYRVRNSEGGIQPSMH